MKIVTGHAFSSTAQDEQTPVGRRGSALTTGIGWLKPLTYLAKAKLDLLPAARGSALNAPPKSRREAMIRALARRTTSAQGWVLDDDGRGYPAPATGVRHGLRDCEQCAGAANVVSWWPHRPTP